MAVPDPRPEIVCTTLITRAIPTLVVGENLFAGPVKPSIVPPGGTIGIPRNCVFCFGVQSFEPTPYFGVGKDFRPIRIQTFVRWSQDKYEEGQAIARLCWSAMQRADVSEWDGYFGSLMSESDIQYFGLDDQKNHRFTCTTKLLYKG